MKKLLLILVAVFLVGHAVSAQCEVSENFDTYNNGDVPVDWTMINTTDGTNAYGQVTPDPNAPSPSRYFRMYSGNATTGDLIFVSPLNATTSDGNHRVTFFTTGFGDSSLVVGTIDTPNGTGTFSEITTIAITNSWIQYDISIPAGTNQYLAFKHDLATTFDQVNLDSICLEVIPTCLEVSNVLLSNPTQTTVDIAWDESGSSEDNWEYVVQEVGTGVPTTNGTAYTSPNASISFTVTGLELDTEYEAYVRADCGGGDFGAWIAAGNTVRTDCGALTSNFCEDWAGIPDNSVPFCWNVYDDPLTGGHAYVDMEFSGYNKNMFELFFSSNTVLGDIVAISPDITYATDGTHRLRFTAGTTNSTTTNPALNIGTINGTGDFVQITTVNLTTDRNQVYFVDLPNNGHANFAFQHGGEINKYLFINTVCVEDIPSCLEVTDVTATNVQYNAADISWLASGSAETTWEYLVQEATLPAPDATTNGTETTNMMETVTLGQNTAYIAYVRAKCDTTDFGAWIASEEFTTACDVFVAEYNSGFEGLNVDGEEIKPCWNVVDTTNGDFRTYSNSFGINAYEDDLMLRMYFATNADPEGLYLITPEFSDLANDKQIRFRMNKRASNEADFTMLVGTMTDPGDLASFTLLDDTSLNQTTVVADTWTEFTIDLSSYDTTLGHSYIAFKPQHSGTGSAQYVFMDDFNYEFNPIQGFNDEPTTANILLLSDNYDCNNAITGNFVGATQSPEYTCSTPTYENYADLWYRFTPTETAAYAFGVQEVTGDPINMFLFGGSSVNPELLSGGCSTLFLSSVLNAGQTYFVAIASDVPMGEFSLCVYQFPEVPVNDEPSGALDLTESTNGICENATVGHTASATHSADSQCAPNSDDVWYTFVPATTANYTFKRTLINGSAPTSVGVYSGTPGNFIQLTNECTSYLQTVDLIAGETYYVNVSSAGSSIPTYFELCVYPSPPAPSNNECVAGIPLTVGVDFETSFIIGDNTSATRNAADPLVICEGLEFEEKGKDVWYTVTIPDSGNITLETRSNNDPYMDDTGMQAYSGTCGALETIFCNSDGGQGFFSYMELTDLQPGTEILVRVWGYVGRFGTYKLAAFDNTPTCEFPSEINVEDITETTALLSWTAPPTTPAGGYEYIVQLEDSGYPGAGTGVSTNETEVLLENLTPNTAYEVYVKSICSLNGSAWEGPYPFTTEAVLGISDNNDVSLKFYPNPVKDVLNFSTTQIIEKLTVYSLTGQIVHTERINATEGQINLSRLSTGMYLVEAQASTGSQVFKVFVE